MDTDEAEWEVVRCLTEQNKALRDNLTAVQERCNELLEVARAAMLHLKEQESLAGDDVDPANELYAALEKAKLLP